VIEKKLLGLLVASKST